MAEYGLLVDYEWCTGCHSCEMACAVEHGFPQGQCGVVVCEVGPWSYGPENDRWQVGYRRRSPTSATCALRARLRAGRPRA